APPRQELLEELEAELGLGAAELDLGDLLVGAVLGGVNTGVFELLVSGFYFHRRRERRRLADFRENRVRAFDLEIVVSRLQFHAAGLDRVGQGEVISFRAEDGKREERKSGY